MRFGSIRAFLMFLVMLEGVGYECQHPLFDIEEGLKALPYYISKYQVTITPLGDCLMISLVKDKASSFELKLISPQKGV